ncbi:MAG: hypothetical protein BWY10_01015 [Chloroflexi bacterium ADurb.Bin180]|nr:MAG: hypothetical protein BWY10_01015 [Chloroflexi bacterium ADurb.Bin180]
MQAEITSPSPLLDSSGRLTQVGWSRQPLLDCNLENVSFYRCRALQPLRVKRWDYYGLTTPELFFSVTLSHVGYLGLPFIYAVDLATGEMCEETLLIPFGKGVELARNSTEGACSFDNGRVKIAFTVQGQARTVRVDWPAFNRGEGISCDLTMSCPPEHESMVIVTPIASKRFYYNRKTNCLRTTGWIQRGGRRSEISPDRALATLDWGRGVWEYKGFWVWASSSGFLPDGRTLGLNMGYGFGDTSAATENAFILDGRVHKLEQVDFEYSSRSFMSPWKMHSPDGRLDLVFEPFKERVAKSELLVLSSEVHQMFGRYSGTLKTDEGETLHVENQVGWAEEHHAKW